MDSIILIVKNFESVTDTSSIGLELFLMIK